MAYEKLGLVKGDKFKADHVAHIEDGIANVAFDDLKNKPFYGEIYEDTYTFNTMPDVNFNFAGGEMTFFKVSELQLTYEQLLKTKLTLVDSGKSYVFTPTANDFIFQNDAIIGFACQNLMMGVAFAVGDVTTDLGVMSVPEVGTYMGFPLGATSTEHESISIYCDDVKKIDAKYLPIPAVTTKDNGKLLQVVDGEWAAVAIANGNNIAY